MGIIEQASLRHRRALVLAFPHAVLEVLAVLREPYRLVERSPFEALVWP